MPHYVDTYVGQRVREARTAKNFNQEDLGRRLGVSFQQVQKYERGANRIGCSRIYQIAKILEVPTRYFFEGLDDDSINEEKERIPRRTILLASQIHSIPDENLRDKILGLIRACTPKGMKGRDVENSEVA